jgi:SH3-like domain-containing protein
VSPTAKIAWHALCFNFEAPMQSRLVRRFLVLGFLLLFGGLAHASDVVALKQDAALRARPGEKAKVVLQLKQGQKVRVLERKDRWVKVQTKGKTGWLTRTQLEDDQRVDADKDKEADGKEDRKGKEEGWGTLGAEDGDATGGDAVRRPGGIKVRVGDEVTFVRKSPVYERPNEKADIIFTARKGERMTVVSLDEEWVRIQDDDGNKGWCKATDVGGGGSGDSRAADDKRKAEEDRRRRDEQAAEDKRRAAEEEADRKRQDEEDRRRAAEDKKKGLKQAAEDEKRRAAEDVADRKRQQEEDDRRAAAEDRQREARDRKAKDDEQRADRQKHHEAVDHDGDHGHGDDHDQPDAGRNSGWLGGGSQGLVLRDRWQTEGKFYFYARADLGFLTRTQRFESDGDGLRANYDFTNTAPTLRLEGGVVRPTGPVILVFDLSYLQTIGGAKISVASDNEVADETLGWKFQDLTMRLHAWYPIHRKTGLALGAHLGYRRAAITVENGDTARLPSERFSGLLVGIGLDVPYLTRWVSFGATAALMVQPDLTQTPGLTDGTKNDAVGWLGEIHVNYHWKRHIMLQGTYALAYEGTAFGGTNAREASAEGATRVDRQNEFMIGATYLF